MVVLVEYYIEKITLKRLWGCGNKKIIFMSIVYRKLIKSVFKNDTMARADQALYCY